jgi:hypothetical protein
MLQRLFADGVPIHEVGLQCHMLFDGDHQPKPAFDATMDFEVCGERASCSEATTSRWLAPALRKESRRGLTALRGGRQSLAT